MDTQINIQTVNIFKAIVVAALIFAAVSLCRHISQSRVSAPAATMQWAADSSWLTGWER